MINQQLRRLAGPAYLAAASLLVFPLFDQTMQLVSTAKLHDARWRFGATGLLGNLLTLPVIGLVIIFLLATALEHRVFRRIMAVLGILAALSLVAATILFLLDAIQVRSLMRPEVMSSWAVATATAIVKLLVAIMAIAWSSMAVLRNGKEQRPPAKRGSSDLILADPKLRAQ